MGKYGGGELLGIHKATVEPRGGRAGFIQGSGGQHRSDLGGHVQRSLIQKQKSILLLEIQ